MEVVVNSDQIRRIGFNILDKIYGPLKKHWGEIFTEVFVDQNSNPRIGFYNSILRNRAIYILKEDFFKFKSVIPIDELEFAEIFTSWLDRNYSIGKIDKLLTSTPETMKYRTLSRSAKTRSY
jgi:hypothetical protein